MTLGATIGRALRLRCPGCGRGRLFAGFLSMNAACSSCGLGFHPEHGYYVGAMYVNYLATAAVVLPVALLLAGRVRPWTLFLPLAAFGLSFPWVFFRWSRSLWLGIELYIRSRTTEP